MRIAFAALVLALLATGAWVAWREAFPEWRHYEKELRAREIERLTAELEEARSDLDGPEAQAELSRIEAALTNLEQDDSPSAARLREARAELAALDESVHSTRRELRKADARLREPATELRRDEIVSALEDTQRSYAEATGTWPPDTLALANLWTVRDSLAVLLAEIDQPTHRLRSLLEEKQAEAAGLRREIALLSSTRDSLRAALARRMDPITKREAAIARLMDRQARLREISSPDGREVARCPTCHGTLDDPPGAHPPLAAREDFRDVPCTVCHRGRGRALTVKEAHQGLLTAAGTGAGPYSLRSRIDRLAEAESGELETLVDELRSLTGVDPAAERGRSRGVGDPDSAIAMAWAEWWAKAERYFEPAIGFDGSAEEAQGLLALGVDPWVLSARGRALRYVGSQKCLSCHEVQHREHSRRWLETKFRSIERLVDVEDPKPCFPCHTTGYDPTTGAYAEPGVTCEGCHGPGERYNEMMFVGQELIGLGEEVRGRLLLDQSSRLAREAVSQRTVSGDAGPTNVCVKCHHPRRHEEVGPGILERDTSFGAEAKPKDGDEEENLGGT